MEKLTQQHLLVEEQASDYINGYPGSTYNMLELCYRGKRLWLTSILPVHAAFIADKLSNSLMVMHVHIKDYIIIITKVLMKERESIDFLY